MQAGEPLGRETLAEAASVSAPSSFILARTTPSSQFLTGFGVGSVPDRLFEIDVEARRDLRQRHGVGRR